MTNIYLDRIDNALRVLRAVSDKDFALNSWRDCALGHCAKDAWFQDQGVTFQGLPSFENQLGCHAGAALFGVSPEVSRHLFVAGDGITGAYKELSPSRRAVCAQFEVLRMKKLAEIETGGKIEVEDFVAIEVE